MASSGNAWKLLVLEAQLCDSSRRLTTVRTLVHSLQDKVQIGTAARQLHVDLRNVFAAWWSTTAEARLERWSPDAENVDLQVLQAGGPGSYPCMARHAFDSFASSSDGSFVWSEDEIPEMQLDVGSQGVGSYGLQGFHKASVELADRLQCWESQGQKARALRQMVLRAWSWWTFHALQRLQGLRHLSVGHWSHCRGVLDSAGPYFIAWELLVLRGHSLQLKLKGSRSLQGRFCSVTFGAWKAKSLLGHSKQSLCEKLKLFSEKDAVRSCWKAWRSTCTREVEALEAFEASWERLVASMLRSRARQTALECLVDAMEARTEREHAVVTEQNMALHQRAERLLLLLAFIVWQFACEAGRLRHVLDRTDSTGKAVVAELAAQHAHFVRLVALQSVFASWSWLARLARLQRQCQGYALNSSKQGHAEVLGLCLVAWRQSQMSRASRSHERSKLEALSGILWRTSLSTRWFYRWMWVTQRLRADRQVPERSEPDEGIRVTERRRLHLRLVLLAWAAQGISRRQQRMSSSSADSRSRLSALDIRQLRHVLFRDSRDDAIRCVAFLAWKVEHLQESRSALKSCEQAAQAARQQSTKRLGEEAARGLLQLTMHAWCQLKMSNRRARTNVDIQARLAALLSSFTIVKCFQKWLWLVACPVKLLSWVRIVQLAIYTKSVPLAEVSEVDTGSNSQLKEALSPPKEDPAQNKSHNSAAEVEVITDEESQPEEEQLPAVYQPVMCAQAPSSQHGPSLRSSSKLQSFQRPDDAKPTLSDPLLSVQDELSECCPNIVVSPAEDLRRRLYLKQAPLVRRVFHRLICRAWFDATMSFIPA